MANYSGGSGNDSQSYGGVTNDTMYGNAGNDTLISGDGDDDVYGGTGQDSLYGGGGMDWLSGAQGNDMVDGGDGADTAVGGDGRDAVYGGTGNDYVTGDGFVSDQTYYSPGTGASATLRITNSADGPVDLYRFDGGGNPVFSQTLQPGQSVTVSTRVGDNWTLLDSTGYYLDVYTVTSTSQTQNYGSLGLQDTLYGGTGDDTMSGMFGDDQVYGDAGNDSIHGDTGNDGLYGGDGGDRAWGDDGNDSVVGGSGADSLYGGSGNDLLSGDADNDSLNGDAGNDTIQGGSGNDQAWGGDGNDTLSGGVGADTLFGGNGSDAFWITDDHQTDTIFGGESTGDSDLVSFSNNLGTVGVTVSYTGNEAGTYNYNGTGDATGSFSQIEGISGTTYSDTINAAATTSATQIYGNGGADLLTGGSAADTIDGGDGNDTLNGGAGNDSVYGGSGEDSVDGGAGNDRLEGRAGSDTIYGGLGDDVIDDEAGGGTGTGNDQSFGGAGNDTIYSGDAHDTAYGGVGNDLLSGESGNDTLAGGDGNDTLTGGAGNDTFVVESAGDGDVITDFSLADQLDVSDLTDGAGGPVKTWDVVVTDDGFGNAKLTFPEGETLILQGIAPSQMSASQLRAAGIPCFASGTMIATPRGAVAVETLRPGDLVTTLDHGPQPVVWAAARHLDQADLAAAPHLRPVRLTKGFTGTGRELLVSPHHAMLMRHPDLPGTEALVRAAHLARLGGRQARIATGRRTVTYVHLMFARHQIVFANGCPSESFYPGPWGLAMLDSAAQRAIARQFPDLARDGAEQVFGPTARPVLSMADLCRLAGAGSRSALMVLAGPIRQALPQTA